MPRTLMDRMLDAVRTAIPNDASTVAVGVSGGLDSTILLRLARQVAEERPLSVIAVHAQHRLRGRESERDEAVVRELARSLAVAVDVREAPVDLSAGGSLEDKAREARYALYREAVREHGASVLLLGHQRDDQLESVLMRIRRRSGLRGLRGIPRARELMPGCRLVRPLLEVPRGALKDFAEAHGIRFAEDSSNRDLRFERNRVRHELLPLLRAALPDVDERLLRVASLASAALRDVRSVVAALEPAVVRLPALTIVAADALAGKPAVVLHELFAQECERLGGRAPGPLAFERLERVVRAAEGVRALALTSGIRVRREGARIWVMGAAGVETGARPIESGCKEVAWPALDARICVEAVSGRGVAEALEAARRDSWTAVLESQAIDGGLVVRPRRRGETMQPLGGPGRRRLKRLFVEKGIPRALRELWPVIADESGVLWAPGILLAERARLTERTRRAIRIEVRAPKLREALR